MTTLAEALARRRGRLRIFGPRLRSLGTTRRAADVQHHQVGCMEEPGKELCGGKSCQAALLQPGKSGCWGSGAGELGFSKGMCCS